MHKRRQAQAAEDQQNRDGIALVIDVKAVALALDAPHTCQCPVEAVSPPVHDQHRRGKPEPVEAVLSKPAAQAHAESSGYAHEGQLVGRHPSRKAARHAGKHPPLKPPKQDLVDTVFGFGSFHVVHCVVRSAYG